MNKYIKSDQTNCLSTRHSCLLSYSRLYRYIQAFPSSWSG